jgi:hypothetical protein
MDISIHAIIPIDGETYRKHKAVQDACNAAGVDVPEATTAFLAGSSNGSHERQTLPDGVHVNISKWSDYAKDSGAPPVVGDVEESGAIIDLSKLPPGTTKIRVGYWG